MDWKIIKQKFQSFNIAEKILSIEDTSDRCFALAIVGGILGIIIALVVKITPDYFYSEWWSLHLINRLFTLRSLILGGFIACIYKFVFLWRFPLTPWFILAGTISWVAGEAGLFDEQFFMMGEIFSGAIVLGFVPFFYSKEWDKI